MYKKIFIFSILACMMTQVSWAQTEMQLSLSQAQTFAIENNANVKNANLNLISSEKKIKETTAIGLPQFAIKLNYKHLFAVPEMSFPITNLESYNYDQATDAWTVMDKGDIPASYRDYIAPLKDAEAVGLSAKDNVIKLGTPNNTTIDFVVSQLIFSGEYIVGLQASRTYHQMSQRLSKKTEKEMKEQVTNAYYTALVVKDNANIIAKNFENLQKLHSEMKALLAQGLIEETDVDQMEYNLITLQIAKDQLERQSEIALNYLKFQIGMDLATKVTLTESLESIITQSDKNLLNNEFDVTQQSDYLLMETNVALQSLSLKREKSKYLPTIAAFYQHEEQTNAPAFNFMPKDVIGVQVDIPIFQSGMRNYKVSQARIELEKTVNSQKMMEEGLKLEFQQSYSTYIAANQKFNNEKKNMELAQKIFDKTVIKYKAGVSTSMDLTQAQNQFLTAQSNYFKAISELMIAKNKMDKLQNRY